MCLEAARPLDQRARRSPECGDREGTAGGRFSVEEARVDRGGVEGMQCEATSEGKFRELRTLI